ncbi:alpha/beta hydrolase [Rhodohalobacter barkolensis]|uniref:Phospholipase n=1 Tax=Rhodohalobacter barkolensis TaxID=2053187 RepID=A0A2N0VI36_9BACT|nr:alpha/beta hydrolase [Rhodohalobacter barkolensis]PKD43798.1 phospholipase [Rhodohalobacter barkolensis]
MFKASSQNPFEGPHQKSKTVTAGVKPEQADGAIVMIHGRGATAESIIPFAYELDADNFHLIAPQASGNTWYPYSFMAPSNQNEPGISSGLQTIFNIVSELEEKGISKEKIVILGFSQGACLTTEFVARHPARYGGLIAFSGGMIGNGDTVNPDNYNGSLEGTPYFVGCSDNDVHIPVERVEESVEVMKKMGATVNKKIYPAMGHTIIRDEIEEAQKIIDAVKNS